jgi:hypothetical protein
MNKAIVVSAFFVLTKGGLISIKKFPLCSILSKKVLKNIPSIIHLKKKILRIRPTQDIKVLHWPRRHLQ